MSDKPTVLFVFIHNAGRSQMAAGYLSHLAGDQVEVLSAGSEPADQINLVAIQAMAEEGIDITAAVPKILTVDAVKDSDVVITMGCGDICRSFPANATRTRTSTIPPARASTPSGRSATTSATGSRSCSPKSSESAARANSTWSH